MWKIVFFCSGFQVNVHTLWECRQMIELKEINIRWILIKMSEPFLLHISCCNYKKHWQQQHNNNFYFFSCLWPIGHGCHQTHQHHLVCIAVFEFIIFRYKLSDVEYKWEYSVIHWMNRFNLLTVYCMLSTPMWGIFPSFKHERLVIKKTSTFAPVAFFLAYFHNPKVTGLEAKGIEKRFLQATPFRIALKK